MLFIACRECSSSLAENALHRKQRMLFIASRECSSSLEENALHRSQRMLAMLRTKYVLDAADKVCP
jgi:hypothetical protein